jgi:hypothetical protein
MMAPTEVGVCISAVDYGELRPWLGQYKFISGALRLGHSIPLWSARLANVAACVTVDRAFPFSSIWGRTPKIASARRANGASQICYKFPATRHPWFVW